jgi:tetratricopeptide (TPR) repeat protein
MHLQAEARAEWAKRLAAQAESLSPVKVEELTAQARQQFRLAGVAYARLATLRAMTSDYPDDLWRSAENYLRGHDFRHAARLFQLYLDQDFKPRRADAQVALGEALLCLGELDRALETFQTAMAIFPQHPATYRARILAAQTHLEKGETADAKTLLWKNLENESLAPPSLEWRDSLFLLGEAHYREGVLLEAESRNLEGDAAGAQAGKAGLEKMQRSFEACRQATQVLNEALTRYPQARQATRAWYFLAEAHREAAKYPRKRLALLALEATRTTVERELQSELAAAVDAYDELLDRLAGREKHEELAGVVPAALSDVENAMLRNAHFGRADALFDLGRYEEAIRAYTLAANRYQNDPVALEAFVQIASCHRRQRRTAEAHGVLEQAKVVLGRIASEADFERTTRYSRKHWEELLDLLTAEWK